MLKRAFGITSGLVVIGLIGGAMVGLAAALPYGLKHWGRGLPADGGFIGFLDVAPWALVSGAVLGAALSPLLAWTLLRRVPLWRAITMPLVGAVSGAGAGWLMRTITSEPDFIVVMICASLGAVAASIWLRLRTHVQSPRSEHLASDSRSG